MLLDQPNLGECCDYDSWLEMVLF